jgi:hypothetical protein
VIACERAGIGIPAVAGAGSNSASGSAHELAVYTVLHGVSTDDIVTIAFKQRAEAKAGGH